MKISDSFRSRNYTVKFANNIDRLSNEKLFDGVYILTKLLVNTDRIKAGQWILLASLQL